MTVRTSAGRLLALAVLALPCAALAADLDYRTPPFDPYARSGTPYDDPRYADIYTPPPPRYVEPRLAPPPPAYRGSYKDGPYLEPPPVPPRFSEAPRYLPDDRCLPRREIRNRLAAEGWGDFHEVELRGPIALVRARRPSGRIFDLRVDRCTGDIVDARPIGGPVPRPYAYAPRDYDRYDRSY